MIYVITINWNNSNDTIKCLESLKLIKDETLKIIVCDNKSTDDSYIKLLNYAKNNDKININVIQAARNGGFAYGNNIALGMALKDPEAEYFWLLNNDTIVTPHALSSLRKKSSESEAIGICGSTLLFAHEPMVIQAVGGKYNSWLGMSTHLLGGAPYSTEICEEVNQDELDYVVGASMLVSRNFIEKVGLMDERYFLYCEELDWATRAKRAGFKLGYAPCSLVYHKEGGTTQCASHIKPANRPPVSDRWALRSHLLYSMKFSPFRHPVVRAAFFLRFIKRVLNRDVSGGLRALWAMLFVWR